MVRAIAILLLLVCATTQMEYALAAFDGCPTECPDEESGDEDAGCPPTCLSCVGAPRLVIAPLVIPEPVWQPLAPELSSDGGAQLNAFTRGVFHPPRAA